MKRWAVTAIVLLGACLSPGASPLLPVDTTAPTIVSMNPNLPVPLVQPDGGADFYVVPVAGKIDITFSEQMDPKSLRPGLAVRYKGVEDPLNITAPEATQNLSDTDRPMTVSLTAAAASGFEIGINRLVLRDILIDQQGNNLVLEGEQPEAIYFFLVK